MRASGELCIDRGRASVSPLPEGPNITTNLASVYEKSEFRFHNRSEHQGGKVAR